MTALFFTDNNHSLSIILKFRQYKSQPQND